jgi:hypothetical protein
MIKNLNFDINPIGKISKFFLDRNITSFEEATIFIKQLPYRRNKNKADLTTVFSDNCGTCSTKHAVLKQLAEENNVLDLKLFLGLFRMNAINTPAIKTTLDQYQLSYIPEAHNYLMYDGCILDYTNSNSKPSDFSNHLIAEIEITINQINDFKISYHQQFLKQWLTKNTSIAYNLDQLWVIREQCIKDISAHQY